MKYSTDYLRFLLYHKQKENGMPSYTNIAKHLSITKQAVHQLYYNRGLTIQYQARAYRSRENRRKAKLCIKCGERPVKKLNLLCCEQCAPKHDPNPYKCKKCGKICVKNKRAKGFCHSHYYYYEKKEEVCIRCGRKRRLLSHKCCASCYGTLLSMYKRYSHLLDFGVSNWKNKEYDTKIQLKILGKMKPRFESARMVIISKDILKKALEERSCK